MLLSFLFLFTTFIYIIVIILLQAKEEWIARFLNDSQKSEFDKLWHPQLWSRDLLLIRRDQVSNVILARPEAMKLMVYEQDYMQTTDMAQAVIQMWRFHFPRHSAFKWLWFGLFRDDYSVCVCSGWIEEALRFTLFRCTVWKMMTSFYF